MIGSYSSQNPLMLSSNAAVYIERNSQHGQIVREIVEVSPVVERTAALLGDDGTRRLFAELYADPDRPEVRPQEAYQAILSSMQPAFAAVVLA